MRSGPSSSASSDGAGLTITHGTLFQFKVTLTASLNGYSPALAVEFGRKVLCSTTRPSFGELDGHVREVKNR